MEEPVSFITRFANHVLGHWALALLSLLHIKPENPALPIPQPVVMGVIVVALLTVLALILRSRLSVERPGALQQIAEGLITNSLGFGIRDLLEENAGHDAARYVPFVGSISVFILVANLFGAIPNTFVTPPTGVVTVPLACATLTFLYFNWHGIRHHGALGYVKSFSGPVWWLAPLMIPVEMISTIARVLSLTVRLWANIFASDLLYYIFLSLLSGLTLWGWDKTAAGGALLGIFAATVPIAFLGLHLLVSFIQAYVFTILPSVYLGLATADEH
ncbi:MAG TPA: F0F1 ATP synthase subunit A [Terriglobales bacterium]|nr:F0F1 ATP synthase subunit A [Terriglobales bacterium]